MDKQFASSFRSYLRSNGLSIRKAATLLDVSPAYLSLYFSGSKTLNTETVSRLEEKMNDIMIHDDDEFYRVWKPVVEMLASVPWYIRHRVVLRLAKEARSEK